MVLWGVLDLSFVELYGPTFMHCCRYTKLLKAKSVAVLEAVPVAAETGCNEEDMVVVTPRGDFQKPREKHTTVPVQETKPLASSALVC